MNAGPVGDVDGGARGWAAPERSGARAGGGGCLAKAGLLRSEVNGEQRKVRGAI